MSKFYITTAIDYVNDVIHIGHAFQKIAADILARYHRLQLGKDNIFFLTGTDEYGQKAEKAAEAMNVPTREYVREIAAKDRAQQDALNISYNRFIETTDEDHSKVAQEIWQRAEKNGDIYLGKYTGLYCTGCEAYYTESDLINKKCSFHPKLEIQKFTEENFFFRWSKYQDFLIQHLKENDSFVVPDNKRKEMIKFAEKGLNDIPISRTSFTWGVPVPNHQKHVQYVWFDALTNYLTGVGFLEDKKLFEKFWPADIHVLGVDNLRWHALLWPAMLQSAGLKLPKTILVNGFLGINGQKISKSLGNVIRPTEWVEKYGADAVRYYLMRFNVLTEDGDISEDKLIQAYNSDLANGLGNLISRVAKLCENSDYTQMGTKEKTSLHLLDAKPYIQALEEYKFNDALSFVWEKIAKLDKYINEEKPWELAKQQNPRLKSVLSHAVDQIQEIAALLAPFLPETAQKIEEQFKGPKITSQPPLFPRI